MKMLLSLLFFLVVGAQGFTTHDWTTARPEHSTEYSTSMKPMECNFVVKGDSGEIKSPNYPYQYPNNLNCTWKLLKPHSKTVMKILDLDIEDSDGCKFDYLTITIGTGRQAVEIGPLCGSVIPVGFVFHEEVTVHFVSDSNVQGNGFLLYFEEECKPKPSGGSTGSTDYSPMTTEPEMESTARPWTSESYPETTTEHMPWTSDSYPETTTEHMPWTSDSYSETTTEHRPWTSESYPETTTEDMHYPSSSHHPDMSTTAGTGASEVHPGTTGKPPCQFYFTNSSGQFSSPNYPMPYGNNLDCYWTVKANGKCMTLSFLDFDIEQSGSCIWDRVVVTTGTLFSTRVYGPYCGRSRPPTVEFRDQVTVQLTTDASVAGKGFLAKYMEGCGLTEPAPTETEAHPEYTTPEVSWTTHHYPESTTEENGWTTHDYPHST